MSSGIAVLCCSKNSIYKRIRGLDCYDIERDCRTFAKDIPVIAHPPCRSYSRFMHHWAKPRPGERDLALFCTERLLHNGGVLEHPYLSRYTSRFRDDERFRIVLVNQEWFGHPCRKRTELLMPREWKTPELPFRLVTYGNGKRNWENLGKEKRMHTPLEFAVWLINLVRMNTYEKCNDEQIRSGSSSGYSPIDIRSIAWD